MRIYFVLFSILALLQPGTARACVGNGPKYAVTFSKGQGDTITAIMKDPESGSSMEFEDDTGGVGIHLAIVRLKAIAGQNQGKFDKSRDRDVVAFLKKRAQVLEKALDGYLKPDEKAEIMSALKGLQQSVEGTGQADYKEVWVAYDKLKKALTAKEVVQDTRVRASNVRGLGSVKTMEEAGLPSEKIFRGAACGDAIATFETGVGGKDQSLESSLPSFNLGTDGN